MRQYFEQAQKLAHEFRVEMLHRKMDGFADRYCPVVKPLGLNYHWSLDQVEFATDLVFQRQSDWQAIYERLTRTAMHTVKPDNIATFLGRKLNGNYHDEMGTGLIRASRGRASSTPWGQCRSRCTTSSG